MIHTRYYFNLIFYSGFVETFNAPAGDPHVYVHTHWGHSCAVCSDRGAPCITGECYVCTICTDTSFCRRCYRKHDHTHALTLYQEALHPATEEQVSQWTVQKVIARVGANLLVRWDGDWVDSLIPIAGNEAFAEQIGIGFGPVSSEEEGEEEC